MLSNELILSTEAPGGGTQRDALKIARPDDERLKTPDLDGYDIYMLSVFWQLNRDRTLPMSGVGSIPLRAFVDYQALFNDPLHVDEVRLLQRLDNCYIQTVRQIQSEQVK